MRSRGHGYRGSKEAIDVSYNFRREIREGIYGRIAKREGGRVENDLHALTHIVKFVYVTLLLDASRNFSFICLISIQTLVLVGFSAEHS